MLIETDKYQPTSLRRGRKQAMQKDIRDGYTLFSHKFSDPKIITINDFVSFWTDSQLSLLLELRSEQEDEQEYVQVAYHFLIQQCFLKESQSKKIFALLMIYFVAYSVDGSGDRNDRPIHVTAEFIAALTNFLRQHINFKEQLFIKIIPKLRQRFVYSIKTGLRNPLIKKNGDTLIRYPRCLKKLPKNNYSPALSQIRDMLPQLQDTVRSYHEIKESFLREESKQKSEETTNIRQHFLFDKNIGLRLSQILRSYEGDFIEEEPKVHEEEFLQQED